MEIKVEFDNDVIILSPNGNLVANTVATLKEQIAKLIAKKYFNIIIDMKRIGMVDSTGLGACMAISRELSSSGGLLVCVGLNENVKRLFHLTRIDQKITLLETRHDAVDTILRKIASASS